MDENLCNCHVGVIAEKNREIERLRRVIDEKNRFIGTVSDVLAKARTCLNCGNAIGAYCCDMCSLEAGKRE
jgi:hypothetical protein